MEWSVRPVMSRCGRVGNCGTGSGHPYIKQASSAAPSHLFSCICSHNLQGKTSGQTGAGLVDGGAVKRSLSQSENL